MRNNDCLHCQLNDTLDMYSNKHRTTGNGVNVDDNRGSAGVRCRADRRV
jgi:hypothetical protein